MLWQGLVGISWHTRVFFLLCWFVNITDTASWDDLWNVLVHSWPTESSTDSPGHPDGLHVLCQWYSVSRYYTLDYDSFTLEHNDILKWQFLPEVKTLRGDKAAKFCGQLCLLTVVDDSSSVSVSIAAFISEKCTDDLVQNLPISCSASTSVGNLMSLTFQTSYLTFSSSLVKRRYALLSVSAIYISLPLL